MWSEGDEAGEAWAIPVEETNGNDKTAQLRYGRRRDEVGGHLGQAMAWILMVLSAAFVMFLMVGPIFMSTSTITFQLPNDPFRSMRSQLELYRMHVGDFPPSLAALFDRDAAEDPEKWYGPYTPDLNPPIDAWGRPFLYQRLSKDGKHGYWLVGAGPDGWIGTADDQVISGLN